MPDLSPDSTLAHYRIISKLGAGGMGEVYLAQDISELGRTVALKILPGEVAENKARLQRFTQEARTVSNLNHPNVLTVYEFGQDENVSFIASEYIDGVTLRQFVSSRRLKLIDVLDVTIQVVAALTAAHEAGVMHRDLKPENVMVRKDHIVKVLDFGLAKVFETPTVATSTPSEDATVLQVNTSPGVIMGTVSYMSPEQTVGRDVDPRTDIWSTGVLLYEMLSGHVPFKGKDIHRQIIEIQEKDVPPLSQAVEGLPDRLVEIIEKCLAKDKNERYQTAKDLLIDLRNVRRRLDVDAEIDRTVAPAVRSTSVGPTQRTQNAQPTETHATSSAEYLVSSIKQHKIAVLVVLVVVIAATVGGVIYLRARNTNSAIQSIAVMPFVNEGGNSDLEYLTDGMTETLMSSLSQIPNLNVKARSLVFRYKNKDTNPQTIGRDLNVQALLNGRVVQRGADLMLYLELVDATTGNLIWSDQYTRKQADLVSLQSDIARDVSRKLKIRLSGTDEVKLTKNYTENSEAYRLYLQGRYLANKRTPKDTLKAIECFKQAIAIDPNYAVAYWGLGTGYSYLTIYGDAPAAEMLPRARQFALKALELDNTLAEPHIFLGIVAFLQDHDLATWERESKLALELNPNSTDAHRLNGFRLTFLGKSEEAIAELKRALEIEPLSAAGNVNYAWTLFYAGRIDEGEAQAKRSVELFPDFWLAHSFLATIYKNRQNYAMTVEELARSKELRDEGEAAKLIRDSFGKGGWPMVLTTVTTQPARMKLSPYNLAVFYVEAGDKDRAFAALNEAVDKCDQFIGFIKVDPDMQPLHGDPRFQPLLKRIGFSD
jgi:serine/threonine protein kinase/tetratricopeptide (TPR) repeat protein